MDGEPNHLFVKVERLRRLHRSRLSTVRVRRGDDGTFGLGLTEENQVSAFHHAVNEGILRIGDQIRYVGDRPIARERLASVITECFGDAREVSLGIARECDGESRASSGAELFVSLRFLRSDGESISTWPSDLWTYAPHAVWGAFWTLPIPAGGEFVAIDLHRSYLLTDTQIGAAVLHLPSLPPTALHTAWHALHHEAEAWAHARPHRPPSRSAPGSGADAHGELLLSIRRYASHASISPDWAAEDHDDPWDYEYADREAVTAQHRTEPLRPIPEPADSSRHR